ncbi:MAG: regulatory protein RecX [Actinomycetes bacterium]
MTGSGPAGGPLSPRGLPDTLGQPPDTSAASDPVGQARAWLAEWGTEVPETPTPSAVIPVGPAVRGANDPSVDPNADPEDADPEMVARAIVLRRLTASARTRHELREALGQRGVSDEVAERVLDRFQAAGLVDDTAFARQWVESRQQRRSLSRQYLRLELQRKGVHRDDIDAALAEVAPGDELEAARALGRKKLASLTGVDTATRYRRLAGVLGRRGFSPSTIASVLSELIGR